ncbi:MAG: sugar phosphate isomerase/epimerase [Chloroflexi bacterium]|nr:sugar phosphate isomerase/epimerase [Chloroflexota bacterium]MBU1748169.1 sugar phosphate isomerase/epimerase [Chloroflexota bacterium]
MSKTNQRGAIHTAVRVSYPERGTYDWHEALAAYGDVGYVEVAFYQPDLFLQVAMERILAPFASLPLRATSVHLAQARIAPFESFVEVLRRTIPIAQALDCSLIVVHPTNARLADVENKIAAVVNPLLEQARVTLCWETFAGRRRFLSGIEGIAAFCQRHAHHAACYDTAHLHKPPAELVADIETYASLIRCFHLSNRSAQLGQQHLPLRHPAGDLDFTEIVAAIARSGFAGPLVLEYLPEYHGQLVADARWVGALLREGAI